MKVSKARLEEALELRDAALRLTGLLGEDITIPARGYCIHAREVKMNALTIMHSRPDREEQVDIWQGRKVFAIAWGASETPYVIAFRPGNWQGVLRELDRSVLRKRLRLH